MNEDLLLSTSDSLQNGNRNLSGTTTFPPATQSYTGFDDAFVVPVPDHHTIPPAAPGTCLFSTSYWNPVPLQGSHAPQLFDWSEPGPSMITQTHIEPIHATFPIPSAYLPSEADLLY